MPVTVTEKNLPSRNRSVRTEFRKRQIIDATIDCIDTLGLSQTTIARIAKQAGVSQGIIVFHFQSKEALLEQALRELSHEYDESWKKELAITDNNPVSRLCALVKATFKASICNRKKISVWYAFWGESRSRPRYMELCGNSDLEFSNTLLSLCKQIESVSKATLKAQTAAVSIEGMRDGLWQNFLIGPSGFKRQQAIETMFELIEIIYPEEKNNIQQFLASSG
jgi:TetR/AcrR family transcriptional repressor of bet genes